MGRSLTGLSTVVLGCALFAMRSTKHLPAKLRRYYRRAPNGRIEFRNGLTLNKMAWRMSEVGQCETEPSSLSRFLNEERLPTPCQLKAFADVLELSEHERWELEYATMRDLCERGGYEFELSGTAPIINVLVRDIELLRKAIDEGEFDIAVDMLRSLYVSRSELVDAASPGIPMLRIMSMVEIERPLLMKALSETVYGEEDNFENLVQIWDHNEEHDLAGPSGTLGNDRDDKP